MEAEDIKVKNIYIISETKNVTQRSVSHPLAYTSGDEIPPPVDTRAPGDKGILGISLEQEKDLRLLFALILVRSKQGRSLFTQMEVKPSWWHEIFYSCTKNDRNLRYNDWYV